MSALALRRLPAVICVAAAVGLAAVAGSVRSMAAPQQTQPPAPSLPPPVTFKVETSYVDVDTVVTDRQGSLLRDLKKEDFQVATDLYYVDVKKS